MPHKNLKVGNIVIKDVAKYQQEQTEKAHEAVKNPESKEPKSRPIKSKTAEKTRLILSLPEN
jgi:hypothetical protein